MATKSVLITKNLPEKYFKKFSTKYSVDMWEHSHTIPRDKLLERVAGKSAILCTLVDKIDGQVLDAAGPQLKTIATISAGFDHIDFKECEKRGISVGNTPEVLNDVVAEFTIGLILATARRFFEANKVLREGKWPSGWGHFFMCGSMIRNSVIGIFGAGRIGQGVLYRLKPFKPVRMLYCKPTRSENLEKETGAQFVQFNDLLKQSDILVVCCALTESTRRLFGMEQFKLMKPTSIFINSSRGAVVDQKSLVEALKSKIIAAAGLDVYETEPLPLDDPLLKLDNVALLPHIGGAELKTREEMIEMALKNLDAGMEGKPLPYKAQ